MKKQHQEQTQKPAALRLSDVKRPRGAFQVKTGLRAGDLIPEKKQKNPG